MDPKILLTTKQMYSIPKLQFGVISSPACTKRFGEGREFGDTKQYAEGCRQQKLTTDTDTREQSGMMSSVVTTGEFGAKPVGKTHFFQADQKCPDARHPKS